MSKRKEFKLKKCPFKHPKKCGEKQTVVSGRTLKFVYCPICGAYGPFAKSRYWAIKKWNERIR